MGGRWAVDGVRVPRDDGAAGRCRRRRQQIDVQVCEHGRADGRAGCASAPVSAARRQCWLDTLDTLSPQLA